MSYAIQTILLATDLGPSSGDVLAQAGAGQEEVIGSVQVLEGYPAETVLAEAERLGADLIVLGSHGHSALGEMLIGSVAHRVSAVATVPVLLVPIKA